MILKKKPVRKYAEGGRPWYRTPLEAYYIVTNPSSKLYGNLNAYARGLFPWNDEFMFYKGGPQKWKETIDREVVPVNLLGPGLGSSESIVDDILTATSLPTWDLAKSDFFNTLAIGDLALTAASLGSWGAGKTLLQQAIKPFTTFLMSDVVVPEAFRKVTEVAENKNQEIKAQAAVPDVPIAAQTDTPEDDDYIFTQVDSGGPRSNLPEDFYSEENLKKQEERKAKEKAEKEKKAKEEEGQWTVVDTEGPRSDLYSNVGGLSNYYDPSSDPASAESMMALFKLRNGSGQQPINTADRFLSLFS
jgi:hypothetical protein